MSTNPTIKTGSSYDTSKFVLGDDLSTGQTVLIPIVSTDERILLGKTLLAQTLAPIPPPPITNPTLKVNPPSSSSSPGYYGQIAWDTNYIYICVATNTWSRVALSSF